MRRESRVRREASWRGCLAEIEVQFRNFDAVTLYYTLVWEHGSWKVDDIANQQGEYPWSLRALLEGARR
jgi:hypothetical protein